MVLVYVAIKATDEWSSVERIAAVSQVSAATTGRHLGYFANHGVLDVVIMHPAYYYKLSSNAESVELTQELERLAAAFGC